MEEEEEENFLLQKNCTLSLSLEVITKVNISIAVLWGAMPCRQTGTMVSVQPTASTFILAQSSTLKMEAMETSKVFVAIYQTVSCYSLKDHNT